MATAQEQTQPRSAAFLTRVIELFCAEISETFNVCMTSMIHASHRLTVREIEASLELFSAVTTVSASGDVSGGCYMLFDKEAVLALGTAIVASPDEHLSAAGSHDTTDTGSLCDAIVEIGNLLVHSADSVSGDFFCGSVLFSLTDTLIGNSRNIQRMLNSDGLQDGFFVPYNITFGDDAVLNCAIIIPEMLDRQIAKEQIPEQVCNAVDEVEPKPSAAGPVTESIRKMVRSLPTLHDSQRCSLLQISAEQIMHTDVAWASGEHNVRQAMDQLLDTDAVCLLIGQEGKLDGIATWIDLAGAASIYLQPMFKQWRRPADDATLQIKLSVIMTSPVCTVGPDTPLKTILGQMMQYHLDCIPVVDENKTVRGVVTTTDIFRLLLAEDDSTAENPSGIQ